MTHYINHTTKEKQYICLLLNKLFADLHYHNRELNTTEEAMQWLVTIRQVDGIMISVRGSPKEAPFCVNTENNMMCFEGEYP